MRAGINVMSSYGLTEVFGPVTNHIPDPADPAASAVEGEGSGEGSVEGSGGWDMARCTRQVGDAMLGEVAVRDPETLQEVPPDGRTMGEVMMRGNLVMNGYLNNEAATSRAFKGGWFRSGEPNGRQAIYIMIAHAYMYDT
jgi:fatty-acyl-CoA synthase